MKTIKLGYEGKEVTLLQQALKPSGYSVPEGRVFLYSKWEKGRYKGGMGEYDRLEQARKIYLEAADSSASWGMFQIMGFNYTACGEKNVESFVATMHESELKQLILAARFIRQAGILPALQTKNWAEFARRYNGPVYAQNGYDKKLVGAYMGKKI